MKIFGIGFHKTGTTTLGMALEILGYDVVGVQLDLVTSLRAGDLGPAFERALAYNAFQDNPWPIIYQELDEHFPGSKFILTARDPESWLRSCVNHFGASHTDMRQWIYGYGCPQGNEQVYLERYLRHYEEVMQYFRGREDDLLVVNWQEGAGWKELCGFLRQPIPDMRFPHANRRSY